MNFIIMLSCLSLLLAAVTTQLPKPCEAPPLMSGDYTWIFDNGIAATGIIAYDASAQRVRVRQSGILGNRTAFLDQLMLYSERTSYVIDWERSACSKQRLYGTFFPMHVPEKAKLMGQFFMGSSSSQETGVLVNNWYGGLEANGTYYYVFTETDCVPISFTTYNPTDGWVSLSTFNWVVGVSNPMDFIPPHFCNRAQLEETEQPLTFFTALAYLARKSILNE